MHGAAGGFGLAVLQGLEEFGVGVAGCFADLAGEVLVFAVEGGAARGGAVSGRGRRQHAMVF